MTDGDLGLIADSSTYTGANSYADGLADALLNEPFSACDIVVLPEYSVPRPVLERLLSTLASQKSYLERERVLVLGSHIDGGYNLAPILHISQETGLKLFFQPKDAVAEQERGLVSRTSTGHLTFRTNFGNIMVLVCLDAFNQDLVRTNDADIILIPSRHSGAEKNLPNLITTQSKYDYRVRVFANSACGRSRSRIAAGAGDHSRRARSRLLDIPILNSYGAKAHIRTVDLIKADQARARKVKGRSPDPIFPVHRDLWKGEPENERSFHQLDELLSSSKLQLDGEIADDLMIDWAQAEFSLRARKKSLY